MTTHFSYLEPGSLLFNKHWFVIDRSLLTKQTKKQQKKKQFIYLNELISDNEQLCSNIVSSR